MLPGAVIILPSTALFCQLPPNPTSYRPVQPTILPTTAISCPPTSVGPADSEVRGNAALSCHPRPTAAPSSESPPYPAEYRPILLTTALSYPPLQILKSVVMLAVTGDRPILLTTGLFYLPPAVGIKSRRGRWGTLIMALHIRIQHR
jgi:hypothetical protein